LSFRRVTLAQQVVMKRKKLDELERIGGISFFSFHSDFKEDSIELF
jgi:hypothetical protein